MRAAVPKVGTKAAKPGNGVALVYVSTAKPISASAATAMSSRRMRFEVGAQGASATSTPSSNSQARVGSTKKFAVGALSVTKMLSPSDAAAAIAKRVKVQRRA